MNIYIYICTDGFPTQYPMSKLFTHGIMKTPTPWFTEDW